MMSVLKFLDADWNRLCMLSCVPIRPRRILNSCSPRFASVTLLRIAQCLYTAGWMKLAKLVALINFFIFGIEVPPRLFIGPGLVLMHTQGTVLGAARIGANVTIYHQVTLGASDINFSYTLSQRPVVEDGVVIGAGAKVLGGLVLGSGCIVGANAVVLKNVPPEHVAVGVPACILTPKAMRSKNILINKEV